MKQARLSDSNGKIQGGGARPPISAGMVFLVSEAAAFLGLPTNTLPREIRKGRLRASKRAGRHWILGEWLLEWLGSGEVKREPLADCNSVHTVQAAESP